MTTLLIAVIFLSLLIIGHEFGHFAVAKIFKLKVEEFGFGFPPRIFKRKIGETVYSLGTVPFGGFVKIYGENPSENIEDKKRSFQNLPAFKKALVVAAGAVANLIIGWLAISAVFMIGIAPSVFIGNVSNGSPADIVGLRQGDQLIDFGNIAELTSFIDVNRGKEITLNIVRNEENLVVKVTPRLSPPAGEGPLGVSLMDGGVSRHGFFGALYEGGKVSVNILGFIFMSLFGLIASLFHGNWGVTANITGPVGIFGFLGTASSLGFVYLLQILGLISLNLTAINVIPFPALDGGRLFFILYEKLSGGRLNYKFETAAHAVGFAVLILLMAAVTVRDIINLV